MFTRIYSLLRISSIITSLVIVIIICQGSINYKIIIWGIVNFLIILGFILDYVLPENLTGRIGKWQKLITLHNKLKQTNREWYTNLVVCVLSLSIIVFKILISMWLI